MKISGVLICYNEEKQIRTALESLSRFCDEIIAVDSGSTDKTLDILKEFNCKIFTHEFDNHRDQKNRAIEKASNEWVVLIDCDEYYDDHFVHSLADMISNNQGIDAFAFPRKNFLDDAGPKDFPDFQVRLFKNYVRHFGNPIHHDAHGNAKKPILTLEHGCIIHEKTMDRQKKNNRLYYAMKPHDYGNKAPEGAEDLGDIATDPNKDYVNINISRDYYKNSKESKTNA
jgi:glycosyltransferase involved in cell wall biosynthesis